MQYQLSSMHEYIRRLKSQLAGESNCAGGVRGSSAHGGSPGVFRGSHNTHVPGGSRVHV